MRGHQEACTEERIPPRWAHLISSKRAPPRCVESRSTPRDAYREECYWASRSMHRGVGALQTSALILRSVHVPSKRALPMCVQPQSALRSTRQGACACVPRSVHRGMRASVPPMRVQPKSAIRDTCRSEHPRAPWSTHKGPHALQLRASHVQEHVCVPSKSMAPRHAQPRSATRCMRKGARPWLIQLRSTCLPHKYIPCLETRIKGSALMAAHTQVCTDT